MYRLTVVFSGDVQGVGFRAKAKKIATELNISGCIQNCPDGSVRAILEGHLQSIFPLIESLASYFTITNINIIFDPYIKQFHEFLIL